MPTMLNDADFLLVAIVENQLCNIITATLCEIKLLKTI